MFGLGETETLVILLAILLLFGAKRIPDVAKSLGSGIREFRRAMREISDEVHDAAAVEPPRPKVTPPPPAPTLPAAEGTVAQSGSTPPPPPPATAN